MSRVKKPSLATAALWTAAVSTAAGAILAAGACVVRSDQLDLSGQDIRLTVLHTADWHSRLIPYVINPPTPVQSLGLLPENAPFGGAARMSALATADL